jgi:hypothetical protein
VQAFKKDIAQYGDASDADSVLAIEGYGMAAATVAALEQSSGGGGQAFTLGPRGNDCQNVKLFLAGRTSV